MSSVSEQPVLMDDKKKAAITAKLRSRDEERQNAILKRQEEKQATYSNEERLDFFLKTFNEEKKNLEEFINNCETQYDKSQMVDKFEEMSLALQKLQKYIAESTLFLPSSILGRALSDISDLHINFQKKKEVILPKKKFAFKNRKKISENQKPKPTSEIRSEKNLTDVALTKCHFSDKKGETLVKKAEEINKEDVALVNLTGCTVKLFGSPSAMHFNELTSCKVFCGPVSSSIFIRNCTNCTFILACHQLRIHQSTNCQFYIHVTSKAIIEACNKVTFAPYNWEYTGLDSHFELSGLNCSHNAWDDIDDFNWLCTDVHSPNWSIIPEEDRVKKWDIWKVKKITQNKDSDISIN